MNHGYWCAHLDKYCHINLDNNGNTSEDQQKILVNAMMEL